MTPEFQAWLIKFVGGIAQAGIAIACAKLLPNNPELLALIMSSMGAAYGGVAFNTPVSVVRAAKGLVSVHTPSEADAEKMRQVIQTLDSKRPSVPGGNPS